MTALVLDASAVASWLVPAQRTNAADKLLTEVAGRRLLAPHIFPVEIRQVLLKAERKGATTARTEAGLEFIDRVGVQVRATDHPLILRTAFDVARRRELSIYDALYLQLALMESAELASRDNELLGAAVREGVSALNLNDAAQRTN